MTNPTPNEARATFLSTTGGVMTDEAGAITGELELACRPDADRLNVLVRYAGAGEWYTVTGSPIRNQAPPEDALRQIVRHLSTPGPVVDGNEMAVTLKSMPGI